MKTALIVSLNPEQYNKYRGHRQAIQELLLRVAQLNFYHQADTHATVIPSWNEQIKEGDAISALEIHVIDDSTYSFGHTKTHTTKVSEKGYQQYGTITAVQTQ